MTHNIETVDTRPENILEVRDLKKYFLINKEWKLKKAAGPAPALPETGDAELGPQGGIAADVTEETADRAAETAEISAAPKAKRKLELEKTYVKAVDGVSFDVPYGKTLGVVGESGCGKSTMGRTILRLHDVTAGKVFFEGRDITAMKSAELRKLRPEMQIVFQDPYSSLPPRLPVGEIIGEAVKVHKIVPKSEYRDYVIEIMRKCGLQDFYFDRYPHEFSGGQRQRIGIARAIILNPELIIADEPISALDVSIQAQVINLLNDLRKRLSLTILFIAHDLSVVKYFSDRIGVMYFGKLVELATSDELFSHPLHPYTKSLLSAIPLPDPAYEKLRKRIVYNPLAEHDYGTDKPVMREVSPGHFVYCNEEEFNRYKKQLTEGE